MLESERRAALRTRRPAFRLARQASGGAARDHRLAGEARGAVHLRHPHRHRRDAARAHRGAAGAARSARAPRSHPGGDHPEFPRQARTRAWRRRRSRRSTTISGRSRSRGSSSAPTMNIQAPPNLSPGALDRAGRRRHQRLGRRVAGDARPRQSRSAVAASRRARAGDQRRPARRWSSGSRSIPPTPATPKRWLDATLRDGGAAARRCRRALRAPDGWSPGASELIRRARHGADRRAAPATARSGTRRMLDRAQRGDTLVGARHRAAVRCARRRISTAVCAAADALRARSTATASAMSSTATSTTPTSAISAASSAPSPRASSARICAAGPTTSALEEIARRTQRGLGARRDGSLHAGRHPSGLYRRHLSRRSCAR